MARSPKKKQKKRSPPAPLERRAARWPVTQAWVNADWKTSPVATVVLLRESPGGALAAGGFLVDLGCRGVREAFVRDMDQDVIRRYDDDPAMDAIAPSQAAAIVRKAEAWAVGCGLGDTKVWRTCRGFVDAIPLDETFDVPLGRDDKPFYVATDSDRRPEQIVATLERTVGAGNYTVSLGAGIDPRKGNALLNADTGYQADAQALITDLLAQTEAGGSIDTERLGDALRALTRDHTQLDG